MYDRHSTAAMDPLIDEIRRRMDEYPRPKTEVNGQIVKIHSLRLRTFAIHGTVCSSCGLHATHFAVERTSKNTNHSSYHINLYGINSDGREVLFTHDHTLARALGGKDSIENTTTMCSPCNNKKSQWGHALVRKQRQQR